jgi:hypothetical protein
VIGFQLIRTRRDCRRLGNAARNQVAGDGDRDRRRAGEDRSVGLDRDHQPADDLAQQDRDEGSHLDQPVAANQFVVSQVLRQYRVLDRPEQRRMHAHQAESDKQQHQVAPVKSDRADDHDADLENLDQADQARLFVLVG